MNGDVREMRGWSRVGGRMFWDAGDVVGEEDNQFHGPDLLALLEDTGAIPEDCHQTVMAGLQDTERLESRGSGKWPGE